MCSSASIRHGRADRVFRRCAQRPEHRRRRPIRGLHAGRGLRDLTRKNRPAIMRARADGILEPHPFIRRGGHGLRHGSPRPTGGRSHAMVSTSGTSAVCGPRRRIRFCSASSHPGAAPTLPVASRTIWGACTMPPTPEAAAVQVYDHLVADIPAAAFTDLPQEPNCPCGAAFSADGIRPARSAGWARPCAARLNAHQRGFLIPRRTWPTGWLAI